MILQGARPRAAAVLGGGDDNIVRDSVEVRVSRTPCIRWVIAHFSSRLTND